METNYSVDRDLSEARAIAEALEGYVRGGELYGTTEGMFATDPDMPSVTVGTLLLRLRRLQALESRMTPEQKAILTEVESLHDAVLQQWGEHYHEKVVNEAGARLRALEAFLAECEDDRRNCAEAYLPEALRRTIVQEIVDALQKYKLPDLGFERTLRRDDDLLRRFTELSHFVWDETLRDVYPREKYWWLYERPTEQERATR